VLGIDDMVIRGQKKTLVKTPEKQVVAVQQSISGSLPVLTGERYNKVISEICLGITEKVSDEKRCFDRCNARQEGFINPIYVMPIRALEDPKRDAVTLAVCCGS